MSVDDDDDVAIPGDMEPELPMGAEAVEDDEVVISEEPSGHVQTRGRVVSDKTREAFRLAQQSVRAQLKSEAAGSDFGEYDEGYTAPEQRPAAATATPGGAPVPPAPAAVAPVVDPAIEQQRQRLEMRQHDLDAREKTLLERESAADVEKLRDAYFQRGSVALVDMIKQWTGIANEDDLRDEVADLITELSGSVLGVTVPPEMKAKIDAKRATKGVRAEMAKLTAREQKLRNDQQTQADRQARSQTEHALQEEIAKPETAKLFPFLAAEDTAGILVFDAVEAQYKRDGTMLPWTEGAKRVNDYLEKKWRGAYDRRAHLFAPPVAGQGAQRERPQGDPSGIRRSHTLTNGAPAGTPPAPEGPKSVINGRFNPEAHRAATKQKFRKAFTTPPDE